MSPAFRLAVLGMGVIGKRVVHVVGRQPGLELVGVAVRSASIAVHAQPHLPYYTTGTGAPALRAVGIEPRGRLEDLLEQVDAVVDCGPARSGAQRFPHYRRVGVRSLFCGGERSPDLGPLVSPALNYQAAVGAASLRLTSCNSTALARVVAALGAENVAEVNATVLRCGTDTDKANKGITDGAVVSAGDSHHAADLEQLVPGLIGRSQAVTLPMVSGHVIQVRLRLRRAVPADDVRAALHAVPRISLRPPDEVMDTAVIKACQAGRGRRWRDRYELVMRLDPPQSADTVTGWLSLDNEAIIIPELLDVVRAFSGSTDPAVARSTTDDGLSIRPRPAGSSGW